MQGWIKLHRKIQEHWLYQEKRKFSRFEAWIDLLMMVNHEDKKVVLGNKIIEVKRGQRITSIRQLCDRWGWSNTKVVSFLKLLEEDGMATVKSDTKKTLITIEKYDFYQGDDYTKTTQKRQENDVQTTQKHTNKNEKNDKNEKNNNYTSKIKDLLTVYSKKIPDFIKLNKDYWDVIRETRTTGKVSESVIYKTMKKWERFDPVVIQYALKTHIEAHAGKREEYTIGIMRNTSKEEAEDRLNSKVADLNQYRNKKFSEIDWEAL